ncbi:hypothetical protein CROQUDRAFT_102893 [Cronartium quercuum f. sp. fusiforme G11]|uniref:Uncharacterized protein n=1 Tax=Cronartium quercuum f. sp. fusiforme G11 TaxID=708437 RepID=A0A9P6TJ30_9BASI|nr:hypothetical protein CROQUDRAFT_102893 [Cronartium quercuum f. sp. fusiforme G11]
MYPLDTQAVRKEVAYMKSECIRLGPITDCAQRLESHFKPPFTLGWGCQSFGPHHPTQPVRSIRKSPPNFGLPGPDITSSLTTPCRPGGKAGKDQPGGHVTELRIHGTPILRPLLGRAEPVKGWPNRPTNSFEIEAGGDTEPVSCSCCGPGAGPTRGTTTAPTRTYLEGRRMRRFQIILLCVPPYIFPSRTYRTVASPIARYRPFKLSVRFLTPFTGSNPILGQQTCASGFTGVGIQTSIP